jgi:DNA-binding transcriptional regulator YdaS (Cro superfamily)
MDLLTYIKTLDLAGREAFAEGCSTSVGYLKQVAYGNKQCGESLAINIERESRRVVTCEELRPDVDWAYLRGSSPATRAAQ